jgi:cephalosporin hydroxylase
VAHLVRSAVAKKVPIGSTSAVQFAVLASVTAATASTAATAFACLDCSHSARHVIHVGSAGEVKCAHAGTLSAW